MSGRPLDCSESNGFELSHRIKEKNKKRKKYPAHQCDQRERNDINIDCSDLQKKIM